MSSYKLISSDSHIFEPPDLWENWIEPKYRDRAPRVVREEKTDQWYADGDWKFGTFNLALAGVRFENPEQLRIEGRYEEVPAGGMDPHAHVEDLDVDGVAGGVLYPSQALLLFQLPDGQFLSAIFRAYNNYMADVWNKPYPNRLKSIAMINNDDVVEAVEELQRVAKLGFAGAMIPLIPLTLRYNHPDFEPLWAAAQDLDMPLSLHAGTFRRTPDDGLINVINQGGDPRSNAIRDHDVRGSLLDMIYAGVFERYPKLKVGAVEFEVAWVPYFLNMMDLAYTEKISGQQIQRFKGGLLPSDYFHSNVFISFQEDDLGVQLRSYVGVDNLQWASDYPHAESTFPRSQQIVEQILQGVPDDEAAKIAGENAAKLYKFN